MIFMRSKKKQTKLSLSWWPVAVILVILGIFVVTITWISGALLILIGTFVSPPVFTRFLGYLNTPDPMHSRVFIVWIATISATALFYIQQAAIENRLTENQTQHLHDIQKATAERNAARKAERISALEAEFSAGREGIIASINVAAANKDWAAGGSIIDHFGSDIRDFEYIGAKAKIDEGISKAKIAAEIVDLNAKAKELGTQSYETAIKVFTRLVALEPDNTVHKQMLATATAGKIAADRAQAQAKYEAEAEKNKPANIKAQFSGYDGSHRGLERLIKSEMNDPSSYDHVETRYTDHGNYITVYCTFRGKNAFGGLVRNTKAADFSIEGIFLREIQ